MLNFIANAFEGLFELFLWLNLIGFTIIGYIVGAYFRLGIMGAIIGAIVGIISDIFYGGFLSIFLRIDKNLKKLVKLNEGKTGESDELQACPETDAAFANANIVAAVSAAIKSEVNISASNVCIIEKGDSLMYIKSLKDNEGTVWSLVRKETGEEGWCPTKYLQKV
jgi:ABC-type transport system involved in multi-copper enzyme maturation permease subunit